MTVIGAEAVERAARSGEPLRVAPRDLVTPLARERARDLGVEIVTGPAPPTAAPSPTPPRPPARASAGRTGAGQPTRVLHPARAAPRATVLGRPAPPVGPPSGALYRRGAPVAGSTVTSTSTPPST